MYKLVLICGYWFGIVNIFDYDIDLKVKGCYMYFKIIMVG